VPSARVDGARRWAVLAGSGRPAAERFLAREGLEAAVVLTRDELLAPPGRLRRAVRDAGADGALVHSVDWRRQPNPQLYELALAVLPVRERVIVDERAGASAGLARAQAAARVARFTFDGARAVAAIGREALRLALEPERPQRAPAPTAPPAAGGDEWVLAVWPGNPGGFGGSTTHISGILGGFRALGFRVALVTRLAPVEQLARVVDEVTVVEPPAKSYRVNADIDHIACNDPVRRAGLELARRLRPRFVYQRHTPFLLAGARIAEASGIPLVLEWNGSEAWIRDNWEKTFAPEALLTPLVVAMERRAVARSAVVAAVSTEAARMALEAGAAPESVVVLPNAVDVRELDAAVGDLTLGEVNGRARLGWAGTFGPWHGAQVMVQALARLPRDVTLVMVGDGDERPACQTLSRELGVDDRIEWTGALVHDRALSTLAGCDLLVSPHTPLDGRPFFGSPTKLFEYMALARPIVASDLEQIGEVLRNGVTARLVTPGDVDELAQAILEVLRSRDRGRALAEAARREVEARHTWDERARELVRRLGVALPGAEA
jgi:glycosyltransferase involved in cell wall biosynthesis